MAAAASQPGGRDDLLSPKRENVGNRQLLGLVGENAEETSDVSASLFKEISSEEEMEVISGTPHGTGMGSGILGMNGVTNAADFEAETSGEDGSLFEEIGGDDSHFRGLGGVQQSAYDRAANGDNGAAPGYILGGGLRFQTEDVPFIRAARGDLDGPLDGPLASLRREDGASLHIFEEKLSSIFDDLRAKEESSSLAGICRDYATSSGEEGGVDAVSVILTDTTRKGIQHSVPVKGQESKIENVQETVEVLMVPVEQGTNVKIVSGMALEKTPEVARGPLTIEGKNPTDLDAGEVKVDGGVSEVISSSPKEAPKKRGRASRELGALLMDAKGSGRGRKAAGLQPDLSDTVALAEPGAAGDGLVGEPSEGLVARFEARITRSRASGRLAAKNEILDVNSLDGAGSQDMTTKRTGKRSAPKKGGRLGWGNGLENSADGGIVAGESSILSDKVPAEGENGAGLGTGQGGEDQSKESEKGSEGKSGGRAKKARGKGRNLSSEGGSEQLTGFNSHREVSLTAGVTTDITKDFNGLETQSQIDEVLITPLSAGTLSNLGAQETETVEPAEAVESNSGGRRRSNRQKAKLGVQPEAEQFLGHGLVGPSKRKQQRKSSVSASELPQIPSGSQEAEQEVGSSEDVAGHLKPSEQNPSRNVGDDVEGVGSVDSLKEVAGKGRKAPRAKSTTRKAPQKRGKKNVEVSVCLEGPSNIVLGSELAPPVIITDAILSLENETSTREPEIPPQESVKENVEVLCTVEGPSISVLESEPVPHGISTDDILTLEIEASTCEAETGKESCGNAQDGSSNRLETIGGESCLDPSKSDLRSSSEQGEDFPKPSEVLEEKISPPKTGEENSLDTSKSDLRLSSEQAEDFPKPSDVVGEKISPAEIGEDTSKSDLGLSSEQGEDFPKPSEVLEKISPAKIAEESSLDTSKSDLRLSSEQGEDFPKPSEVLGEKISPAEIGEESSLDTSNSDLRLSSEQREDVPKPSEVLEVKISPEKLPESGTDVDSAPVADEGAVIQHRTSEGGNELIINEAHSEKLETCGSSPISELVTVDEVNSKAELGGRSCVSVELAGVSTVVDCEAGGSAKIAVKSEKCPTVVVENCNMDPCVRAGIAKDHDVATKRECGVEQNATDLSFAEAIASAKDEGVVDVDRKVAVKKPSKVKTGRLGGGRKGAAAKKQQVDNGQGSEAVVKPKGRARKKATTKQNSADEASPLVTDIVVEAKTKVSTASRRGKRKLNIDNGVGSVVPGQETSTEPSKDKVVDDAQTVVEISEKAVKSRQKDKNTIGALAGGAAKKRRKTGKLEGPQLDTDPCSVATAVNASSEGPTEGLPVGSESELKTPQRGKAGQKKSQKALSGKKVTKKAQVGDKSKQRKKPPRTTAKSKGGTVKVLSTIKDQSSQERQPATKSKSAKPKAGKATSKLQADSADHCAADDAKADGEEKGQVLVESASLNQEPDGNVTKTETDGNVTKTLQNEEVVRDTDGGAVGEDVSSGVTEGGENKGSEKGIDSAGAETGAARKSWVLCDDCNKWRCIPVELADLIESTNARWSCRENPDKVFQDCSVPQEKSNAEINAELEISEVSVCEEGDDTDAVDSKSMNLGAANEDNKPAVWKRIRRNIFQHRRRKVLEIDEMMVCQCKPPEDGGVGCGENCLNRMLSIECVAEQCPCGEACTNQQFQNRTYAPIDMYRCGKKGFGLKLAEKVPKGTFIIEYVGEVLDVGAFEKRQQEYARKGQKHFYFMTLNTNEVIDACSKGNYGRFINHSCEPNCRTEKWMVNGEVCIGLFAVRDIAKEEEVTFDYNYVRVCGAAAKKCECGSSQCRGFIGGDPLTPKAVLESDSEDEEDLEPIMVENSEDEDAYVDENKLAPCKKPRPEAEFQETMPVRTIGIKRKLNIIKEKSASVVKRFKSSGSSRRITSGNYKGLTVDISGGRHESSRAMYFSDVQEKLDEMLDRNGGLRKRRDAAKQYLKLLVLTSASGDSRKDATACSVRDLSLLLEALLKTTSRTVLSDIMNKNGLRMLHNLIKQLRRQWDKTPILRKLIKVLDLLASQRVLTTDLITSGPPCSGMESFSESLFELTRHKDTEVVHMVRRFRNKWMPPRIWDQHYRGFDKPYPMQSMQSSSQAAIQQTEQLNSGSNMFQSPQHLKQVSEVSRPGSCEVSWPQGSNLKEASQSQNGRTEEGATLKEDVKSITKVSELRDESNQVIQPTEQKRRKRPSRWDAPARVEKASTGPADPSASTNQSDVQGVDSGKQTTFPVAHVSQGSVQVSFEGTRQTASQAPCAAPQALNQAVGPPVPQAVWPYSTSSGFQDSAGLHHPHTQFIQGMLPAQHIPGAPAMQMQLGLPSTNMGFQQTPNSNAIQFGPPPLPARGFPQGPPIQIGPGVPSAQGMHGLTQHVPMGTVPAAPGYPREARPPPMAPTAPYGQWRPPPGAPNFTVAHAFQGDRSQIHTMPLAWPLQRVDDGAQVMAGSDEVKRNKEAHLPAGADADAEPPVPGLSPRPPPPGEGSVPMVWTDPGSHSCQEFNDMAYYQAQWMPPHYMQGPGINQEYYGSRDPYARDPTWGYPGGEYWETPEGDGFREDVFALVSMRVHKHHKLRTRDLDRFCSKMADVIVRKEVAKYIEHRNQGIEKIIMKSKLIEKVDSYVDNQVGLYLKKLDKSHNKG
ncbi:unnamed protein product [Calypogeia fissa]